MKYQFIEQDGQHLHTLDGKALIGTSSVEAVLSKPLTWWASGKAVETLGWVYPKIKKDGKVIGEISLEERLKVSEPIHFAIGNDTPEEYLNRLDEAYKAHLVKLRDTAKSGTNLHAELEKWVKYRMGIITESGKIDEKISPFILWAEDNVKRFLWSEAHTFCKDLWVGGISDAGAELIDGRYAVIDFKSSKETYTNQFIQAAGYAIQIDKNGLWSKDGEMNKKLDKKIEALIIVSFGAEEIKPEIRYVVDEYKKGFEWCVGLYRLLGMDENYKQVNK